jgi:16S rRNA (adenine1518-N6/adenine1519-N6)-dimethyltransferase
VTYLEHHFKELEDRIISNDFLRLDIKNYFGEEKFAIIGNFPYNISTQILFRVFENHELVPFFGGMFQKEVAARICSKGGNKDYGILSVLLQAYYDIEYLFTVNEDAFFPPPKVKSGVMQMKMKNEIADFDKGKLKNLVKTAFNHRRKMLSNTISHIMPPDWPMEYRTKRPEQLSVEQFIELAKIHI